MDFGSFNLNSTDDDSFSLSLASDKNSNDAEDRFSLKSSSLFTSAHSDEESTSSFSLKAFQGFGASSFHSGTKSAIHSQPQSVSLEHSKTSSQLNSTVSTTKRNEESTSQNFTKQIATESDISPTQPCTRTSSVKSSSDQTKSSTKPKLNFPRVFNVSPPLAKKPRTDDKINSTPKMPQSTNPIGASPQKSRFPKFDLGSTLKKCNIPKLTPIDVEKTETEKPQPQLIVSTDEDLDFKKLLNDLNNVNVEELLQDSSIHERMNFYESKCTELQEFLDNQKQQFDDITVEALMLQNKILFMVDPILDAKMQAYAKELLDTAEYVEYENLQIEDDREFTEDLTLCE
ncbi:hypothetical protein GEMRC1_011487 [Eukaryota sp. GEM-RC1]